MKSFNQKIIAGLFIIVGLFMVNSFSLAAAPTKGTFDFSSNSGLSTTADKAGYNTNATSTPETYISTVITILLAFIGVVFLGLMIYGGITWMTAGGNEQTEEKAKKIIEESIIGLIVVLAAYALSYFIIQAFSSPILTK